MFIEPDFKAGLDKLFQEQSLKISNEDFFAYFASMDAPLTELPA